MKMLNQYDSPLLEIVLLSEDIVRTSDPSIGGGNTELPPDNPFFGI
jgi:hypothetical protein